MKRVVVSSFAVFLAAAVCAITAAPRAEAGAAYVGSKKCKMCHIKQAKSWEGTKMGKAFELLKPNVAAEEKKKAKLDPAKDYTTDTKCLPCHTVGYGKGGYDTAAAKEDFQSVGCEVCHGPGGDYLTDDRMSNKNKEFKNADLAKFGFVAKPTEEQCRECHNEKSPFYKPFDFAKRKAEGIHEHVPAKFQH